MNQTPQINAFNNEINLLKRRCDLITEVCDQWHKYFNGELQNVIQRSNEWNEYMQQIDDHLKKLEITVQRIQTETQSRHYPVYSPHGNPDS